MRSQPAVQRHPICLAPEAPLSGIPSVVAGGKDGFECQRSAAAEAELHSAYCEAARMQRQQDLKDFRRLCQQRVAKARAAERKRIEDTLRQSIMEPQVPQPTSGAVAGAMPTVNGADSIPEVVWTELEVTQEWNGTFKPVEVIGAHGEKVSGTLLSRQGQEAPNNLVGLLHLASDWQLSQGREPFRPLPRMLSSTTPWGEQELPEILEAPRPTPQAAPAVPAFAQAHPSCGKEQLPHRGLPEILTSTECHFTLPFPTPSSASDAPPPPPPPTPAAGAPAPPATATAAVQADIGASSLEPPQLSGDASAAKAASPASASKASPKLPRQTPTGTLVKGEQSSPAATADKQRQEKRTRLRAAMVREAAKIKAVAKREAGSPEVHFPEAGERPAPSPSRPVTAPLAKSSDKGGKSQVSPIRNASRHVGQQRSPDARKEGQGRARVAMLREAAMQRAMAAAQQFDEARGLAPSSSGSLPRGSSSIHDSSSSLAAVAEVEEEEEDEKGDAAADVSSPSATSPSAVRGDRTRFTSGLMWLLVQKYAKMHQLPPTLCACVKQPSKAPYIAVDGHMSQSPEWEAYIQKVSIPSSHARNCEFSTSHTKMQKHALELIRQARDLSPGKGSWT